MENDAKWHFLQSKLRNQRTVEIFRILRESEIEPILLKGSAIERFYPEDVPRPAVDIDIAVAPEDFRKVNTLHDNGTLGRFNIDIHCGLRHLDTRQWLDIFAQSVLVEIEEAELRVLRPEDQLRIACIHWLTDGGERFDRLLDVFYMVEERSRDFDWNYCLDIAGPKRRRWILSVISLTNRFYPMDLSGLAFAKELEEVPAWFIDAAESRWADDVKFEPLDNTFFEKGKFLPQLKRRFPPNPIMATIALNGEIDDSKRLPIQIKYFFKRLLPSLRRSSVTLIRRKFSRQ